MEFKSVIGLEIHAQLLTASKIFCRCSTKYGSKPNSQVCPICLGLPGVLPVLNRKVVEFAVKLGLATRCQIASRTQFVRKNYFYPDLPKGYQISQYDMPLCRNGYLEIEVGGKEKNIGIARIHLEEDAGKSIHAESWVAPDETLIDFNRCGVPLIEIVTEPDLNSPLEATRFVILLRQLLQYLEICNGDMEKGSLRCDVNISLQSLDSRQPGIKTELKNLNSLRSIEKALAYEIQRQSDILNSGKTILGETQLWDEKNNTTVTLRPKELEHDYRYFPEPDLVPLEIESQWIDKIKHELPELPKQRRQRLTAQYSLPDDDVHLLTESKALADYFETVATQTKNSKLASNWTLGEVLRVLNKQNIEISQLTISPTHLAELLNFITEGVLNISMAKIMFEEMLATGKSAAEIVTIQKLMQISDVVELTKIVEQVISENPKNVEKYLSGKQQLFDYFVGQVMKATHSKANPILVGQILKEKLMR